MSNKISLMDAITYNHKDHTGYPDHEVIDILQMSTSRLLLLSRVSIVINLGLMGYVYISHVRNSK